jgi:hypothetical protein
VSWNTANTAVLAEGKRVLIDDPSSSFGLLHTGWNLAKSVTAE